MSTLPDRVDRRALRTSLVGGIVVAALLIVGGIAYALVQPRTFTAESVLVVLPQGTTDEATSAAYYETLSRGQIVATFAEVAGNLRFEQQAEDRLAVPVGQRGTISTEVSVVPDTSVILFRVTAADGGLAERVADTSSAIATEYLATLSQSYRTDVVHGAAGTAFRSGTSTPLLLGAAVIVGLIAGLAVQQAVYHLRVALLRPRSEDQSGRRAVAAPAAAEPPVRT